MIEARLSNYKSEELQKKIQAAESMEADFMFGLTEAQVESRKKDGLVNKTKKKVTKSYWRIICDNVFTFFNIVFFVIAALMIVAGLPITQFFFLAPLGLNIAIGVIADIRVRLLVDRLKVVNGEKATVMRDGKEQEINVDEIVLSDILVIKSGDQIPCDGIVLSGFFDADESLLTGESEAVGKKEGSNVLSGSFCKSGKGYVRVTKIGLANYAETLQRQAKQFNRPKSEIKRTSLAIFWTTGIVAIVMGIAMTATELFQEGWFESLETYGDFIKSLSGSLVAMIPAGLYVLTSATLAIGVYNLYRRRMNVQELYCIEMLARVDVVCFDKTGTLTDGRLAVREVFQYSDVSATAINEALKSIVVSTGDDNATAEAIGRYAEDVEPLNVSKSIPFDSARKFSAATVDGGGTYIMGALEFIDGKIPDIALKDANRLMKSGYRVIGLFHSPKEIVNGEIPSKASLLSVISLTDNIKDDARANIEWFQSSGVEVKIVSGDNPITVSQIANACGVENATRFISMDKVDDEDIPAIIDEYAVFGRVSPEQKALIIEALQKQGHKVAMTGDGVNDIIALKKADCSIAMASGSSAARNAAHIVSLDNDFSKLPDVVREGRRVINNIQRTASLFLAKTTFAILMSLAFLVADWAIGANYPFSTSNMTLWEIFTIGIAGFLLALQPSNERLKGTVLGNILSKAIPAGLTEVLAVALVYAISAIYPGVYETENLVVTMAVLSFTLISIFTLFRTCLPFDRYRTFVFVLMVAGLLVAVLVDRFLVYPNGSGLFGLDFGAIAGNPYGSMVLLMVAVNIAICLLFYLGVVVLTDRLIVKKAAEKKGTPNDEIA